MRGLGEDDLADNLGWSSEIISAIERAETADVTLDDIERLATALSVRAFDLLAMTAGSS